MASSLDVIGPRPSCVMQYESRDDAFGGLWPNQTNRRRSSASLGVSIEVSPVRAL
ncbi:hypothetical protein BDV39DRAFT_179517 [Aspergillus sergii]|uniref:Uncharacterized protein n=1 Tax=Aspergillus sergii TaxID=1034303 RepID=A0A5N6WXY6_9EURO|nr:hypothetical protein BDV39DRAFT_179517 [Aspergillus sergii]